MKTNVLIDLHRLGVVQFGRFEVTGQAGAFQPIKLDIGLLGSYPETLQALASILAPLALMDGLSHLLAMPAAIVVGVATSLRTGKPLVYPAGDDLEGAYDYNVPTLLLTDILENRDERLHKMIRHARVQGLHVEAIASVFDVRIGQPQTFEGVKAVRALYTLEDILPLAGSERLQRAVWDWFSARA